MTASSTENLEIPPMQSIILVGGMGTRLEESRKKIDSQKFPQINPAYEGQIGPKGLAMMQPSWSTEDKPLTDWHLKIHSACKQIQSMSLALGCRADLMEEYYKGSSLVMLEEKNPAGTLAPLIKLYSQGKLGNGVYVYANGDNLADIDFANCYKEGMKSAMQSGVDCDAFVIDIASLVPWEESASYGTLDMDFDSGLVKTFKEKGPVEENAFVEVSGQRKTPINSGFSIIVNPLRLFEEFLDPKVVETSLKLEEGHLEYKGNEKTVKYETFYEKLASLNRMVAVLHEGYWTDLGTEEKIQLCEKELPKQFFS